MGSSYDFHWNSISGIRPSVEAKVCPGELDGSGSARNEPLLVGTVVTVIDASRISNGFGKGEEATSGGLEREDSLDRNAVGVRMSLVLRHTLQYFRSGGSLDQ